MDRKALGRISPLSTLTVPRGANFRHASIKIHYSSWGLGTKNAMRILLCNFEYPPLGGGGGVISALLAEELANRHETTVLTSKASGLPGISEINGVTVIRVPVLFRHDKAAASFPSMLSYLPAGLKAGKRLLRRAPFDIVNTHFVVPTGPVGQGLAREAHVPNVLSVHGGDLYDPSKWTSPHRHVPLRWWIRSLLRQADAVVVQSLNTLCNIKKYYIPEIECLQIPLGIKRPPLGTASRREYEFADNDLLLVTVGRMVARKAVDQLVSVTKALSAEPVHLLIIGEGPQEASIREKARQLHVAHKIHFLGHVEEHQKFRILRMSDIFVSTSQHEGFGLVFLEAMACGLPIVCYDEGGQIDFLKTNRTGYVLPLNNMDAFVSSCHILTKDVEGRRRMGRENLRLVEDLFVDRCAQRYEQAFEQALGASRSR
jgi:glycosyltransferase involved in cell wall biosynthesis